MLSKNQYYDKKNVNLGKSNLYCSALSDDDFNCYNSKLFSSIFYRRSSSLLLSFGLLTFLTLKINVFF